MKNTRCVGLSFFGGLLLIFPFVVDHISSHTSLFPLPMKSLNHVPRLLSRHHVLIPATLHLQFVLAHDGDAADTAVACCLRKVVVVVRIAGIVTSARHRVRDLDMILRSAALAENPKGGGYKQHEGCYSNGSANAGFGARRKSRFVIILVLVLTIILVFVLRGGCRGRGGGGAGAFSGHGNNRAGSSGCCRLGVLSSGSGGLVQGLVSFRFQKAPD